ncbi:hypothetical protein JXQ70_10300 [bacterium]|nr:hypothetical protein [bacterium]
MKKDHLEKSFEELKDTRFRDTTNLMRVQIDLFLNMLKEVEQCLHSPEGKVNFKSSFFGTDKSLTEAGRDLIFSILENIDFEWERLIITLLNRIERDNLKKFQLLEEEVFQKIEGLSKELYTSQYNAGLQMDKLLVELMSRVEEAKRRRKDLLDSLRSLLEQDLKQLRSTSPEKPSSTSNSSSMGHNA